MFDSMLEGLSYILNVQSFLALGVGILVGIFFGSLPGLTTTMAMAIFVPVTFFMEPFIGIPFLLGIYKGGIYGGSVSAILISTPGTGAAVATLIDGYPLTKQGKAGKALKVALFSSFFGEIWGEVILLFVVGALASVALAFGPPENFAVLLFSFTIIAGLSGKSLMKGVISAVAGLFLSTIGLDPVSGSQRFTFGIIDLDSGLAFIPLLIGLFAFTEVLLQIEKKMESKIKFNADMKSDDHRLSWKEFKSCLPAIGIGSGVGTFIGLLPGIGQPIAALLGYGMAKQYSKDPDKYGTGCLEGVAAPEAANNAVNGSAMVPMLALGIPGDTISAILLGAFIAHGLSPGPLLFQRSGPMVYGILLIMILGNVLFLGIGYFSIPIFSRIAYISQKILIPAIIALAVIGSFAVNNNIFDVYIMIIFGLIGYFMRKGDIPVAPLVITFLLGQKTETAFSQSMLMSQGNPAIFFTRPIALVFMIITALVVIRIIYTESKKRKAKKNGAATL